MLTYYKVLASKERKDILAGLIGDFFNVEVEELAIENPYSIAAYKELVKGEEISVLRNTRNTRSRTWQLRSRLRTSLPSAKSRNRCSIPNDRCCILLSDFAKTTTKRNLCR